MFVWLQAMETTSVSALHCFGSPVIRPQSVKQTQWSSFHEKQRPHVPHKYKLHHFFLNHMEWE